jgi:hypothetical protein
MLLIYASFVFQEGRKDLNQVNQHVLQLAEVVKDVLGVDLWMGSASKDQRSHQKTGILNA